MRRLFASGAQAPDPRSGLVAALVLFAVACSKPERERAPSAAAPVPTRAAAGGAPVGAAAATVRGPRAIDLAMGGDYACARFEGGEARCWGAGPRAPSGSMAAIAVGTRDGVAYGCGLRDGGAVACWAGDGEKYGVTDGGVAGATSVATGGGRACAVLGAGGITCWGATLATQLDPVTRAAPTQVPAIEHATRVAVGGDHACAIAADGAVWCWGNGFYGQLGDGKTAPSAEPVRVVLDRAAELALGARHTCARTEAAEVLCWGDDGMGQLGLPGTSYVTSPHRKPEKVPLDGKVAQLAAGDAHTCARMADGTVECWGSNDGCALGDPAASPLRASPARVAGVEHVAQIAAGARATCARTDDGSLACWGTLGEAPAHCAPVAP